MRCLVLVPVVLLLLSTVVLAGPIDKRITIQVIQVTKDDGTDGAAVSFDESGMDAIWAAADIDIDFLSTVEFASTDFLTIDTSTEFVSLATGTGHGQHTDSSVINLWFADFASSLGSVGLALEGSNGIVLNSGHSSVGSATFLSHFLGHNLELEPTGSGGHSSASGNIMSFPSVGTDLTADQITRARASSSATTVTVIPLPSAAWLGLGLLGGLAVLRRRNR